MYLSNYTPEDYFQRIVGKIHEYGEEARMPNRFQLNEKGELVPLRIPVKQPEIQFRNFSNVSVGKKSCGCGGSKQ